LPVKRGDGDTPAHEEHQQEYGYEFVMKKRMVLFNTVCGLKTTIGMDDLPVDMPYLKPGPCPATFEI
jgi:hypothetical protein